MKIVAMVRFNNSWAYVFDEPVSLKYREEIHDKRRYLIGQDGPFYSFLRYEKSGPTWKAFAGRPMQLRMEDGTVRTVKDDWWSCESPIGPMSSITYSTVDELKKCYVYTGASCKSDELEELIDEYENRKSEPYGHRAGGYRYDYEDFRKIINFDDLRKKAWREEAHLKKANSHLIRSVKEWAAKAKAKPRFRVPAICERIAS